MKDTEIPMTKRKSSKKSDPGSPIKKKDISGNNMAGGYAFAEDEQRSLHFI